MMKLREDKVQNLFAKFYEQSHQNLYGVNFNGLTLLTTNKNIIRSFCKQIKQSDKKRNHLEVLNKNDVMFEGDVQLSNEINNCLVCSSKPRYDYDYDDFIGGDSTCILLKDKSFFDFREEKQFNIVRKIIDDVVKSHIKSYNINTCKQQKKVDGLDVKAVMQNNHKVNFAMNGYFDINSDFNNITNLIMDGLKQEKMKLNLEFEM